jgi:hypothetical protein
MTSTKDFINNDKAIKSNINKISFDSSSYSSHRIPVVLHRREIGMVFAVVKDDLVLNAGEHQKEYLIPKSKITHFDEKHLCVSITDNSLKEFEI